MTLFQDGGAVQGCSSQRLSRTLDAVDWISERNVHDWLHDAVYGLHLAVGWLHDFLVAWGIFIFLGLLCGLTWKFITMMPNVRPKQLDARAESADVATRPRCHRRRHHALRDERRTHARG